MIQIFLKISKCLSFDILGLSFSEKLKKTALHAIGLGPPICSLLRAFGLPITLKCHGKEQAHKGQGTWQLGPHAFFRFF